MLAGLPGLLGAESVLSSVAFALKEPAPAALLGDTIFDFFSPIGLNGPDGAEGADGAADGLGVLAPVFLAPAGLNGLGVEPITVVLSEEARVAAGLKEPAFADALGLSAPADFAPIGLNGLGVEPITVDGFSAAEGTAGLKEPAFAGALGVSSSVFSELIGLNGLGVEPNADAAAGAGAGADGTADGLVKPEEYMGIFSGKGDVGP